MRTITAPFYMIDIISFQNMAQNKPIKPSQFPSLIYRPPIAKTNFDKKALQFVVPLLGLLPKEINVAGNNPPLIRVLVGPDTQYIKASLSSTDPMLPPLELGRNSLPLPNSRCLEAVWLLAEYLVRHGIFLGNYDMITQAGVISTLRIDYLFLHKAQYT